MFMNSWNSAGNFLIMLPTTHIVSKDIYMFLHLKKGEERLILRWFKESEELKTTVVNWLQSQVVDFCEGKKKIVPRYKKSL